MLDSSHGDVVLFFSLKCTPFRFFCSKNASWSFTVASDEKIKVSAYTNSSSGAIFSVTLDKQTLLNGVEVKSPDGGPTQVDIIPKGQLSAGTYKVRGDSVSGMLHSDNFVIVVRAYAK